MDFIAFKNPGSAHAPYPGVKVTADTQALACVQAKTLLGVSGDEGFFCIPLAAFTENYFSTQIVTVPPPAYT